MYKRECLLIQRFCSDVLCAAGGAREPVMSKQAIRSKKINKCASANITTANKLGLAGDIKQRKKEKGGGVVIEQSCENTYEQA